MKNKFKKISAEAFKTMQVEAGLILNTFSVESPNVQDENIITATTGGIRASCVPVLKDHGEDVDNCPEGVKQLIEVTSYACSLGFTALNHTAETIKLALGATAQSSVSKATKLVPAIGSITEHCKDLWFVGNLMDGGMIAICLKGAFTSGGYNLQTTKNGKGQLTVDISGHPDISAANDVPMEFYLAAASLPAAAALKQKTGEVSK